MRLALVAALVIAFSSPAFAGGPPGSVTPETPEVVPTHVKRYGKWVLLADLVGSFATSMVAGPLVEDHPNIGLGVLVVGFVGTGAAVHLYHGNRSGAVKSVLARVLLPIGGALAMAELVDEPNSANEEDWVDEDDDYWMGAFLGGTLGGLTALVLDWAVFSKKTVEGRPPSWAVAPHLSVTQTSTVAGIAGSF